MFLEILCGVALVAIATWIWFKRLGPWLGVRRFLADRANALPRFREVPTPFVHQQPDVHGTHAVLDVIALTPSPSHGAGIFVTGGKGQHNALLVQKDDRFVDVAAEFGLLGPMDQAVYGALLADIDGDGVEELLIAQDSGVYIHERSAPDGAFRLRRRLDEAVIPDRNVPLSIAAADTQGQGRLDLYISTYIAHPYNVTANFNRPDIRARNLFLRGNGDGTFRDATDEAGLVFNQNTFLALWVDLNGDGRPDLIVSPNTDKARCYENLGDGTFRERDLPLGWGYWMGIAAADVTGNGYPDILLSNIGSSIPAFLTKGDSRPDQPHDLHFRLLRNDGDFRFRDVSVELGARTTHFGWGAAFADFTKRGRQDFVMTENYTAMPLNLHGRFPTPGKLMLQGADGRYTRAERAVGVENRHFGYRVITPDLTGNGYPDLVIGNLTGPLRVFLNDGPAR
ncbi:MAG: VCBS repeat-containing protein [Rhodobacteraceae bacterium]|nr:VCBS repeat-containing protein [Paracoccaceae bacterium]